MKRNQISQDMSLSQRRCWRFKSPGTLPSSESKSLLRLFYREVEGTTILRNVGIPHQAL